ncbi:MAG: hypothetical protein LBT64_01545 [Puniceicoccales bacterium]|jgi:hypothetical protein|nr:hypothetical protein [Puniceicoccales bacterium]
MNGSGVSLFGSGSHLLRENPTNVRTAQPNASESLSVQRPEGSLLPGGQVDRREIVIGEAVRKIVRFDDAKAATICNGLKTSQQESVHNPQNFNDAGGQDAKRQAKETFEAKEKFTKWLENSTSLEIYTATGWVEECRKAKKSRGGDMNMLLNVRGRVRNRLQQLRDARAFDSTDQQNDLDQQNDPLKDRILSSMMEESDAHSTDDVRVAEENVAHLNVEERVPVAENSGAVQNVMEIDVSANDDAQQLISAIAQKRRLEAMGKRKNDAESSQQANPENDQQRNSAEENAVQRDDVRRVEENVAHPDGEKHVPVTENSGEVQQRNSAEENVVQRDDVHSVEENGAHVPNATDAENRQNEMNDPEALLKEANEMLKGIIKEQRLIILDARKSDIAAAAELYRCSGFFRKIGPLAHMAHLATLNAINLSRKRIDEISESMNKFTRFLVVSIIFAAVFISMKPQDVTPLKIIFLLWTPYSIIGAIKSLPTQIDEIVIKARVKNLDKQLSDVERPAATNNWLIRGIAKLTALFRHPAGLEANPSES